MRQVGGVVKINTSSLMAPCNINVVTFIPSKEFNFESFNFNASIDGRLHVSDPEMTQSDQIGPDSDSRNATRSSSELDSV